jgi:CDP-glycerol glycerophosphotransferase (TagB/SpsB family)
MNQPPLRMPDDAVWADTATYGATLAKRYLRPLEEARATLGAVPGALQQTVLLALQWYFSTDLRERAPTVIVTEAMAVEFHRLVREIMAHIDVESIAALDPSIVSLEIRHALLSYKQLRCHSQVALDAYDTEQRLLRLSYYLHGDRPIETMRLDGERCDPIYSKYRACRFFRRTLLHERICWLNIDSAHKLAVELDAAPQALTTGRPAFLAAENLRRTSEDDILRFARLRLKPPCKARRQPLPGGLTRLKVRCVRWLARNPLVRRKFAGAWVFVDRENGADDNAEHLYRWVRHHHPEINAWFVILRSVSDWERLSEEGFRLIAPGWLSKLLVLNSEQIISSHTDYRNGTLSRELYGDLMNWRFAFLQHGVIKDDVSHWLSNQPFDLFLTSSPAEHESIVADGTPYTYTDRETRRTGLPRHDALLKVAEATPASQINLVLIMPTWRGSLVDQRAKAGAGQSPIAAFAQSEYARRWRTFLRNDELRELSLRHRKTIAFLPHPNAVPFVQVFELPSYVKLISVETTDIRKTFCRTAAFITDYTSVAFSMAFLRKIVFYYQFDRAAFYGGGHNWREGYFNYERDGFGPVATDEDQLVRDIRTYFDNDAHLDPEYLSRIERAMPEHDSKSCERTFQSILDIRKPLAGRRN